MTIKEYQVLAMRTNDGLCNNRVLTEVLNFDRWTEDYDNEEVLKIVGFNPGELLNGALGLTGEAGEVADLIKKEIFHGHKFKVEDLIKELGDVCWYLALTCHSIGVSLEYVMEQNIEKLKKRYPEGFSSEASINRTE